MKYVDFQKKLQKIIENLTLEMALEIGISRREFYRLKKKLENNMKIILRTKTGKIIAIEIIIKLLNNVVLCY